jgi:hypothetical protein
MKSFKYPEAFIMKPFLAALITYLSMPATSILVGVKSFVGTWVGSSLVYEY